MPQFIDLSGNRYNRLLVIERAPNKGRNTMFRCQCDCGKIKDIGASNLKNNGTKSCGCLDMEVLMNRNVKHSGKGTRLYRIWKGIRNRCNNVNNKDYHHYGGRGISVCNEWSDFTVFRDWAFANGYCDVLTIDRIDNDGNYEPLNCRWTDMKTQRINQRKRN